MINCAKHSPSICALQQKSWIPPSIPHSPPCPHVIQGDDGIILASGVLFGHLRVSAELSDFKDPKRHCRGQFDVSLVCPPCLGLLLLGYS